jgi:hypothetical protein
MEWHILSLLLASCHPSLITSHCLSPNRVHIKHFGFLFLILCTASPSPLYTPDTEEQGALVTELAGFQILSDSYLWTVSLVTTCMVTTQLDSQRVTPCGFLCPSSGKTHSTCVARFMANNPQQV